MDYGCYDGLEASVAFLTKLRTGRYWSPVICPVVHPYPNPLILYFPEGLLLSIFIYSSTRRINELITRNHVEQFIFCITIHISYGNGKMKGSMSVKRTPPLKGVIGII